LHKSVTLVQKRGLTKWLGPSRHFRPGWCATGVRAPAVAEVAPEEGNFLI